MLSESPVWSVGRTPTSFRYYLRMTYADILHAHELQIVDTILIGISIFNHNIRDKFKSAGQLSGNCDISSYWDVCLVHNP